MLLEQEDNILIKGETETDFKDGKYIICKAKLVHNNMYPLKAPDYYVLNPNDI